LQALYLADQLHGLDDSILRRALADKIPAVRAAAIRLSERRPSLAGDVAALASDPDPAVRLQLAFSLGEFETAQAGTALGTIAAANLADPRMRCAVLSSAARLPAPILEAVLAVPSTAPGRPEMVDGLIRTAGASPDVNVREAVLNLVLPRQNEAFEAWRLEAANTLLQANTGPMSTQLSSRLDHVRDQARTAAIDSNADLHSRQVALEILGRPPLAAQDLDLFGRFLNQSSSPELQMAALNGLRNSSDPRAADTMLANWGLKSASLRTAIIDELLRRDPWTERLLTSVEANTVNPPELGPTQRQRLLHHSNASLANRAAKLFQETNPDRVALVASYGKVSELSGNPGAGLTLFAENCSMCHAFRGVGHPVGPDLMTYHDKPASDFILAILHPSAAIEPRFINYQVETKDDRSLSGVLNGETATSITILGPNGAKDTLLRSEIASMRASKFSLMPEGFEAALNHQGMADLIAYLKLSAPAPFGSARESGRGATREKFLRETANPVRRITFASDVLEYASPFGMAPLHLCRQSDGKGRVEWESACHSSSPGPRARERFDVPVAVGLKSQPQGRFTLSINGKPAFDFDVSIDDAIFGDIGGVFATYRVLERNDQDSSGVLSILVPADQIASSSNVRFSVTASAADSQRWFGLYALDPASEPKHQ
jgi:putative heme-binding domain-containing protein